MSARAFACETYGPPTERRPRAAQDDSPTVRATMDMDRLTLVILNRSHSIDPPGPPVCHSRFRIPRARARGQLSELGSRGSQGESRGSWTPNDSFSTYAQPIRVRTLSAVSISA